jgi:hypothetical protein
MLARRSFGLASMAVVLVGFTVQAKAVEITNFTGGDAGEGLDLQGNFTYAVDISGVGNRQVADANFTRDTRTDGFSVDAGFNLPGWATPEYGDTENDDNLEYLMSSIRWSDYNNPEIPTVDILMDVQAGQQYKLQMLFTESCCDRGFDIRLEDELLVDDFVIYDYHLDQEFGLASRGDGVLITHEFTAGDNELFLSLGGDTPDHPDNNGHISAITLERLSAVTPGDFDQNGSLDAADINALSAEVRSGANSPAFNLNGDAVVDDKDRTVWVRDLRKTWFGDANLDNVFNSSDFVAVFTAGQYEDAVAGNSGWATGDWDGDGDFTSGDFVVAFQDGGYEKGPRVAVAAVPEPAGLSLLALGTALALWRTPGRSKRPGVRGTRE